MTHPAEREALVGLLRKKGGIRSLRNHDLVIGFLTEREASDIADALLEAGYARPLPCCNLIEPEGTPCGGTMRAGELEYVCDKCRGRCGAMAHPGHA